MLFFVPDKVQNDARIERRKDKGERGEGKKRLQNSRFFTFCFLLKSLKSIGRREAPEAVHPLAPACEASLGKKLGDFMSFY